VDFKDSIPDKEGVLVNAHGDDYSLL
jgi:hypothetical protein